jgi:hypothetical protein
VLHGSLRLLAYTEGLLKYLCHHRILLKDFGRHSRQLSEQVIAQSLAAVEEAGRPILYLRSSRDRKEDIARDILARDNVQHGTICVLKTVELCRSYEVAADHRSQRIELRARPRKCLHFVSLSTPSGLRIHARAAANVVSLPIAGLPQRAGVAGPPTRSRWNRLCAATQLLYQHRGSGELELYDLSSDVGETRNLAKEHPDVVQTC